MLKELQLELKARVQTFQGRVRGKPLEEWSQLDRLRLQRIAHEQGKLAELTRRLLEAYTGQMQEGGSR